MVNLALSDKQIAERKAEKRKLNIKQDMFCKIYATDPQCLGNGTDVYRKVYGQDISYDVAKASATRFLADNRFTARINEFLELDGFNDETVDKHHLFLIKQKKDLNVSMKGVEHYNRLKKRIDNKLEIIMPKPLMDWDDDTDTIRKIDKSKVKEIDKSG